jgi:hypothetical protein
MLFQCNLCGGIRRLMEVSAIGRQTFVKSSMLNRIWFGSVALDWVTTVIGSPEVH